MADDVSTGHGVPAVDDGVVAWTLAALRSEAALHGPTEPPVGDGSDRALLVRPVARPWRDGVAVRLRPIAGGAAWRRYLAARVAVEEAYGLDRDAVARVVRRMRDAAAAHPIRWSFVVDAAGTEVGAVGRFALAHAGERFWRLQDVDVFPPFRGRGYGNALLRATSERAARDGVAALIVAADEDDWPLAWYLRCGFVRVATVAPPRARSLAGLVP